MSSKTLFARFGLGAVGLALGGAGLAFAQSQTPSDYPLTTCVVSGEKLGKMGQPVVYKHEGREVRFCCGGCEAPFKKDAEKYLKKLDEAKASTTQPSTQPVQ